MHRSSLHNRSDSAIPAQVACSCDWTKQTATFHWADPPSPALTRHTTEHQQVCLPGGPTSRASDRQGTASPATAGDGVKLACSTSPQCWWSAYNQAEACGLNHTSVSRYQVERLPLLLHPGSCYLGNIHTCSLHATAQPQLTTDQMQPSTMVQDNGCTVK